MRLLLAALLLPLSLAACGGDEASEDSVTSEELAEGLDEMTQDAPTCEEVWVVGETLPEDYEGCQDAEAGTFRVATFIPCNDGSRLHSLESESMWVVTPGEIQQSPGEIAEDADGYGAAYRDCVGG